MGVPYSLYPCYHFVLVSFQSHLFLFYLPLLPYTTLLRKFYVNTFILSITFATTTTPLQKCNVSKNFQGRRNYWKDKGGVLE